MSFSTSIASLFIELDFTPEERQLLTFGQGAEIVELFSRLYESWPEGGMVIAKCYLKILKKYYFDEYTLDVIQSFLQHLWANAEQFHILACSAGATPCLVDLPKDAPELYQPRYVFLTDLGDLLSKADYQTACLKVGLGAFWPKIETLLEPEVRVLMHPEKMHQCGGSKIGGAPDLGPSVAWPLDHENRPLDFLAQINMNDFSDSVTPLPKSGLLSFFYDQTGMSWGENPLSWRVIYQQELALLSKRNFPMDIEENKFPEIAIDLVDGYGLPMFYSPREIGDFITNDLVEPYMNLLPAFATKLLGQSQDIQTDIRKDLAIAHAGITWKEYSASEEVRAQIDASLDDWRLLFQLDSNWHDLRMCWGDVGRLYFCMLKDDLAFHRFDKVKLVLQCG